MHFSSCRRVQSRPAKLAGRFSTHLERKGKSNALYSVFPLCLLTLLFKSSNRLSYVSLFYRWWFHGRKRGGETTNPVFKSTLDLRSKMSNSYFHRHDCESYPFQWWWSRSSRARAASVLSQPFVGAWII